MSGPFGQTPRITSVTDVPLSPFVIAGKGTVIQVEFDSTTVDAGNTGQTHILRSGLTVAQYTSGGSIKKWGEYDDTKADGREDAKAFLVGSINMRDNQGSAKDTWGLVMIGGQPLIDEDKVYGLDALGKADLANLFLFSTSYEPS